LSNGATDQGWLTRERGLLLVLIAATAIAFYLCYLLFAPFLPILAWALALAVVAHPLNRWLLRHLRRENLTAALAVLIVAVGLIGPAVLAGQAIVQEAREAIDRVREEATTERWRQLVERNRRLAPVLSWMETNLKIEEEARRLAETLAGRLPGVVTGSVRAVASLVILLFVLFFLFRDWRLGLQGVRALVPLSESEADRVFERVSDTINAAIFGTIAVAFVQGTLGGLMFWWLGLPAPLLWGLVMSLLAMIPMLGTFVIWAPAALFLVLEGNWGKALILAAWGLTAVGLIDNLLYPMLVGRRLRLHPLLVFFSVVGGVFSFGVSGVILGPLIVALTRALLEIWRRRTAGGQSAEQGVDR